VGALLSVVLAAMLGLDALRRCTYPRRDRVGAWKTSVRTVSKLEQLTLGTLYSYFHGFRCGRLDGTESGPQRCPQNEGSPPQSPTATKWLSSDFSQMFAPWHDSRGSSHVVPVQYLCRPPGLGSTIVDGLRNSRSVGGLTVHRIRAVL
jgi:hypothetical protein